jgi:hypothetical protein
MELGRFADGVTGVGGLTMGGVVAVSERREY